MKRLLTVFQSLLQRYRRYSALQQRAGEQAFSGYCADCGGRTLIRRLADQRVTCPQCDR